MKKTRKGMQWSFVGGRGHGTALLLSATVSFRASCGFRLELKSRKVTYGWMFLVKEKALRE